MEDLTPMGAINQQPKPEAADIARYVTDLTAQLQATLVTASLELLAHFLGMANA